MSIIEYIALGGDEERQEKYCP